MTNDTPESAKSSTLVEATVERTYNPSGRDPDYAQQLINMLEKKNRALAITWPILLIISIGLGFVLLSYHQNNRLLLKELDHTQQELDTGKARLSSTESKLEQANILHIALKKELARLIKQPRNWLQAETGSALSHAMTFTSSNSDEELSAALESILARADKHHEQKQEQIANIQSVLAKSSSDFNEIKTAYNALQNKVKEQTSELSTTIEKIDTLTASRDSNTVKLQKKLSMFKQENVRLQKEVNKRISAFDALAKRYKETQKKNHQLSDQLNKNRKKTVSLENRLKETKDKLETSLNRLETARAEYASLKEQFDSLSRSLKAITQPIRQGTQGSLQDSRIIDKTTREDAEIAYPDVSLPE
ncbi:MAG: hypothetical protein CSB48_12885 [Proteobacteria bacterium]|nr:MAG: hypothetical protein CSB48_12885 [Pseudomonadota bacterium]PIE40315.1 MAG: hypothetical protein CSA51_01385 [Gammaproteobacteria bacterium]